LITPNTAAAISKPPIAERQDSTREETACG
jgi:hypothetical protein